ncbi:ATP-binding protein [Streptomyces sp. AN091965]|uniref:ATP-binding protein n=1 Tax=Streptomyces sp. AN091965 TaxID=2927803 RepID=UPI001F600641|nr:ATP-binding protein [Streptomyces sp. AN091965]MCI3934070.1 ATP-binding protein [Streptomyces sp. AN091965]
MHTSETPRLYARDPLLHHLLPRLTGLAYAERARVPWEHDKDLPLVLLTGRHGMGRTAVLATLERHYTGRLPLARVDTAAQGLVVELLEELVCSLAPDLSRRFPLLLPGLVAVYGGYADGAERDRATARIARLLLACRLESGPEPGVAQTWETRVRARLAGAGAAAGAGAEAGAGAAGAGAGGATGAGTEAGAGAGTEARAGAGAEAGARGGSHAVVHAVLAEYFERYARARSSAPLRQWYQDRYAETPETSAAAPDGQGGPRGLEGLLRLADWFHRGGDYRHAAEQTLVHAFLEDVAAARTRWQRLNRDPRPLALLDNTHSPAGARLLDLVLEYRARPGAAHHDPLVVVATRLGDAPPDATEALHRDLPDLVTTTGWRRAGHAPSAGLVVVELTPLSRDDVLLMLDAASAPLHPYLASALHTLTGGHPLAGRVLCDAVLEHASRAGPAAAPLAPRDLLDLTTGDGRPVSEAILERLLPSPHQRARLVPLSLARDSTAAQALAAHLRLEGPEQLPANAAADYLEAEHWQRDTPQDRPLAADPLLHTLLVHEARRTSRGTGSRRGWQEMHGFLRRHHTTRGEDSEADALRHTLAAGDAKTVVAALSEEFQAEQDRLSALRWLTCLRYAATAPAPPAADWDDERAAMAAGAHDDRYRDIDEIDRCINRLLHGLWYLSDATAEPEADLCDDIGAELAFLSLRHRTWRAVLGQAARTWPAAARDKRPLPLPEL